MAHNVDFTTYSTDEKIVGTWIDGKKIYKKTIDCGALPNNSTKDVNHNISSLGMFVKIEGVASNGTLTYPMPISTPNTPYLVSLSVTTTQVSIRTATTYSSFNSYVTLYYTKS